MSGAGHSHKPSRKRYCRYRSIRVNRTRATRSAQFTPRKATTSERARNGTSWLVRFPITRPRGPTSRFCNTSRAAAARRARSTPAVSFAFPKRGESDHDRRQGHVMDLGKWWNLSGWRQAVARLKLVSSFGLAALLSAVVVLAASPADATAQWRRVHKPVHSKRAARAATSRGPLYKGALLEDADSGRVLMAYNADMEWPPASMAKMMNLLVAQEQINVGRFSGNDLVRISERAAHTGGSRVGLKEGDVYPLRELMKAALVKSANDAAVAVAEKIGGSVEAMVRMMNERAQALGMTHTEYQTVDGLPPRPTHDADRTTAYDLATVGRVIMRETNLLMWSSQEKMDFDNGVCMLNNTNHLIGHFEGCDGLKTGFTFQAGFNVTTTAKRGDMRLIAVILGAPSNAQRFAQAAKLMEWG